MTFFQTFAPGIAICLTATSLSADTTLRYSNWLPATHPFMSEVIQPWIEDVAEATEGRVTVEILPKVVGTVPTQFEVVRDGLADMSLIVDGYSAGRFNLNGIVELPFLGNDARAISIAYWRIYKKYLEQFAEYENAIPVAKSSVGPMALATGPGPIDSMDKLNGLKLRVPTATGSKVVVSLGGAPVNKPISEMYELISTGVVDGMISSTETINSFKIAGSIGNLLTVPGGLGSAGISFVVNEETLSELSEADQEAFWSVSGEVFSTGIAEVYHQLNARGRQDVLDEGGTITPASEEMIQALKENLATIDQIWIDKATEMGLEDAAGVLAEFRAEIAKEEAKLAGE
ncbi:MAG: TRAP transporter substrate-binding protein [Heliomarina sp.]|uniref:TRAP transporter substrate-binding protein n=1 Tax=Heliomarina sp. TaxID=2917556 RepID=UPI0040594F35